MSKHTSLVGIMLASLVLLAGCSGMPFSGGSEDLPESNVEPEDYRIGVGDAITIHVWRDQELTQSATVRPDGYISMPLMGDVKAEGKKPEELAEEVSTALNAVIRDPEVTVMVNSPVSAEYRNRVRLTGQVAQPVSLPYRQGMTVLDVVLEAGGLTDFAADGRAILHRDLGDEWQSFEVELGEILDEGNMRTNYSLQPGDVISVPRKQLFRGEL